MNFNMVGKTFGRLTVIEPDVPKEGRTRYLCKCECGTVKTVIGRDLVSGHTKSCGCLWRDKVTKHGGRSASNTDRLYHVWRSMINRCEYPKHKSFKYYGGRGIAVCKEWHDYETFKSWAMDNGYNAQADFMKCTLDREDTNGNYTPDNCRWTSMEFQNKNKRAKNGCRIAEVER
jgi:hypothetical protein